MADQTPTPIAPQPIAPAPEFVTVTLQSPVQRGDDAITSIRLRKPKAGELRGLKLESILSSDVSAILSLVPRISEPALLAHDCDGLDIADLAEIGGAIVGFFLTPAQKAQMELLTGGAATGQASMT